METFEQVWESSRTNAWSGYYSATVCLGLGAIAILSFIPVTLLRGAAKLIAALGFAYYAAIYAEAEIFEKWRIRREWAAAHKELMTEANQHALTVDGANLTLGPILMGVQALGLLFAVVVATELARYLWSRDRRSSTVPPHSGKVSS